MDRARKGWVVPVLEISLFVGILGLPDGGLGVLWPSLRQTLHRPVGDLGVLALAATIPYLIASLLASRVIRRIGMGWAAAGVAVLGAVVMLTWAGASAWLVVIGAIAVFGFSKGTTDAGLNAYASEHEGVRRLGLLHASYGIGATLAPILVTVVLAATGGWRPAVAGLGVLLALVAAVALAGRRNWAPPVVHREDVSTGAGGVEPRRVLIPITIGLFFVYTAAEGSTGTWAFSVLTGPRGMARGEAGVVVAGYWAMFTLGRLAVAAIGHRWPTHRSCSAGLVLGLVAVAVFWANPGHWGWIGLPVAGFGFAPAFPVIISLVPAWIGRKRAAGIIGWCIAAGALGSPIATAVAGGLAGRAGVGWVPAVFTAAAAVTVVVHESAWALAGR